MTEKKKPIDPLEGPSLVLEGRVVTMNAAFKVFERGRIYIEGGVIRAVRDAAAAAPSGFEAAPLIRSGGTIYPGLIELHNHLSYNVLPMWQVPRIFAHRGQWSNHPDKRRLISQPMSVLASLAGTIESVVRFVETKCLVGGVTTSQGLTLMAAPGIEHRYRGIVRNVERTDDVTLPHALTKIDDVADPQAFAKRLAAADKKQAAFLLHLAEGIGEDARRHFLNLRISAQRWAISPALVGIHGAGLAAADFETLATHGGQLVWSPLSNLLLYGGTADVAAARAAGVRLSLGSDWSPSGSKNLLSELKVAKAWSQARGDIFTDRELVAMVTINPARQVRWEAALGSIEPDKRADLLVIGGKSGDVYRKLIGALESDITMVYINGVPRFGEKLRLAKMVAALFPNDPPTLESRKLGHLSAAFNFVQRDADPLVGAVPLSEAEQRLRSALHDLPELASALVNPLTANAMLGVQGAATADAPARRWVLELDNEPHHGEATHETARPLAPAALDPNDWRFGADALALNASSAAHLVSMTLDALSVAEDGNYLVQLGRQINLPDGFAQAVAKLHGATIAATPTGRLSLLPPVADTPAQAELSLPRSLWELSELPDALTQADRVQLVRQLYAVLSEFYVHLPLKRASHAIDPLQQLRLLQYALEESAERDALTGLAFHRRMLTIFNGLRDLHTNYVLPLPYRDLTAFLPFMLERCFDAESHHGKMRHRPVFLVTRLIETFEHPTFVPGVELLYWNGMPLPNAIDANAQHQAGSNDAARFARGLVGMTVRPLARVPPPQEEWVALTYRALDGRVLEIKLPWQLSSLVAERQFELPVLSAQSPAGSARETPQARRGRVQRLRLLAAQGSDTQMEAVNATRRILYRRTPVKRSGARKAARRGQAAELKTRLPDVLRARLIPSRRGRVGHLRIFTFAVEEAESFIREIVRLLAQMPRHGLILDVRNNGGGLIYAAEQMLQLFTSRTIQPERAQFINTPRVLDLVRRHAPSPHGAALDLSPWVDSISRSVLTGALHSEGFPITPVDKANALRQKYRGPVVAITDALAYSATDMFIGGFRDHEIGPILGVDDNTGAGGANVWTYSLLQTLLADREPSLAPLPGGCDCRVAMRRTLRAGASAGLPLEDLGVVPDARHYLTRADVLDDNDDLLAHAVALMSS